MKSEAAYFDCVEAGWDRLAKGGLEGGGCWMEREERSSPPSRSTELETGEERGVREEAPGADGGALMAPTPGGGGRIPPPPLPRERDLSLFGMLMLTCKKTGVELHL